MTHIDDTREPTFAALMSDEELSIAAKEVLNSLDGISYPPDGHIRKLSAALGERFGTTVSRSIWLATLAIKEEVMIRWLRTIHAN